MKSSGVFRTLVVGAALVMTASAARAQNRTFEVGASLASLNVGFGQADVTTFGVPSGGFGLVNPGLYVSVFLQPRMAVEPQIGLIVASSQDESVHLLNMAGQVNYYLAETSGDAPYVFGSLGVISVSGDASNHASFGGGAGYRLMVGGRLVFRFDGRLTHFTGGGGNMLAFTVSIGGLFGQ